MQADKNAGRQADRQRDRETDRQTGREGGRGSGRHQPRREVRTKGNYHFCFRARRDAPTNKILKRVELHASNFGDKKIGSIIALGNFFSCEQGKGSYERRPFCF